MKGFPVKGKEKSRALHSFNLEKKKNRKEFEKMLKDRTGIDR